MSLELNANLTKLNGLAAAAARHEDLSGEDSVIYASSENQQHFVTDKWQRLGSRSVAFKQGNLVARKLFFTSICEQFGGFDRIPESVRAVMKLADFKLDAEGRVTSGRPLTSRRITTVCNAIREYNQAHDPLKFAPAKDPDFGTLTKNLQGEYRDYVIRTAQELAAAGSTDLTSLSVASFLQTRLDAVRALSGEVSSSSRVAFETLVNTLTEDLADGEITPATSILLEFANTLASARKDVLALVLERGANLPARDQALLFQECVSKLEQRISDRGRDIYLNPGNVSKKLDTSVAGILKDIDFTKKPANAELMIYGVRDFMKAYIDQYREEFTNTQANVNEKYHGKYGNKYENLLDAVRCFYDLKSDPKLADLIAGAVDESLKATGAKRGRPCHAMTSGPEIDKILTKIMNATSHTKSNSAAQIAEAFKIFCDLPKYLFQAMDEDRKNGNTELFDQLMDALNTSGCLQARCEALQNVRIALNPELRGVKDDTVSNLSLIDGFAKIAQSLQKKDGNDLVDYDEAVDLYVEKMAKGGKAGKTTLGVEIPGFGAEDSHVAVTREFLMKPEVASVIKNILFIFND